MTTVFLDRDGVINENRPDYVKNWDKFRFLPGACEAIASLTQTGHRVVVCTNQAGVARGTIAVEAIEQIHRQMVAQVAQVGGSIEKVYYCPHAKDAQCACRKPQPGMLLRARDELCLDLTDAVFVGDSISDICTGLAVGIQSILVLTGLGADQLRNHCHEANGPFLVMQNLQQAVVCIQQGLCLGAQKSIHRS